MTRQIKTARLVNREDGKITVDVEYWDGTSDHESFSDFEDALAYLAAIVQEYPPVAPAPEA